MWINAMRSRSHGGKLRSRSSTPVSDRPLTSVASAQRAKIKFHKGASSSSSSDSSPKSAALRFHRSASWTSSM
jgi:hypothetical protein